MHDYIKKQLKKYLRFLDEQPDTKGDQQLIDCANQLSNITPDTEESLNGYTARRKQNE